MPAMRTLEPSDIALIRNEVRQLISAQLGRNMPGGGQPLGFDLVSELVSQVAVPILVSLSSSALYDVLKGKVLDSLRKRQADELSDSLVGAKLQDAAQIDAACMAELKRQLLPLGITESQIQELYEKIRQKLQRGEGLSRPPA